MENNRYSAPWIKHLPNIISVFRLIGAFGMLFTKAFSFWFYTLYTLCGISDLLDGWIARATHNTSEMGAKLDSIADLSFNAIMVIKIFPTLWKRLPIGVWIVVGATILMRIVSYSLVALKRHSFASLHTYMNKLTGLAVFTIPFYINLACSTLMASIGCTIAAVATVEELLIHLLSDEPIQTIFQLKNKT